MINKYLCHNAILNAYQGADEDNEIMYEAKTIKCRFENILKELLTKQNTIITANAQILTNEIINVRDTVLYNNNSYEVILVNEKVDVNGNIILYEAVMK